MDWRDPSVAWFSTTCFSGNCSKRYWEIKSGVELIVDGQTFTVYGQGDDMAMNWRKASRDANPKISLRVNGDNNAIYIIGEKSTLNSSSS